MLCVGLASGISAAIRLQQYSETPADFVSDNVSDPATILIKGINDGTKKLTFEPEHGYLKSLLKELGISVTTQVLVFSKTSLQSSFISPATPRAIYFSENVYVGWIPRATYIEIMSIDPQLGPVFYVIANQPGARPTTVRKTDDCFQCHFSAISGGVPSLMARSVYPDPDGTPQLSHGSFRTTATSPIEERWGGWYVTGTHGSQRHMGNEVAKGDPHSSDIDREHGANVTRLDRYFDVEPYLTPHSDIVALMVLEQQMAIQNLITKAGFLTRKALSDSSNLIKLKFEADYVSQQTQKRIVSACEPLVRALVGIDDLPLSSPIKGTSDFANYYSTTAPSDKFGRRLSALDLKTRLLQYPCSPMIYSKAFSGLPVEAKTQVIRRLVESLSGKDRSADYGRINLELGRAALETLRETLPDFGPSKD